MEKLNILPQFIYKFKSTDELLISTLNEIKNLTWQINENQTNYITEYGINLKNIKNFSNLHQWVTKCFIEVKNDLNYMCSNVEIIQSWANKSEHKMWHHGHIHPNSVFSAIYYLTDSESFTWFSIPSIWDSNNILKLDSEENSYPKNARTIYKEKSKSGNLLIFPSNLFHSVDENKDYQTRYTISFNAFPSGIIGNFDKKMGMEIKIL